MSPKEERMMTVREMVRRGIPGSVLKETRQNLVLIEKVLGKIEASKDRILKDLYLLSEEQGLRINPSSFSVSIDKDTIFIRVGGFGFYLTELEDRGYNLPEQLACVWVRRSTTIYYHSTLRVDFRKEHCADAISKGFEKYLPEELEDYLEKKIGYEHAKKALLQLDLSLNEARRWILEQSGFALRLRPDFVSSE